jgi:hypothetical protein
MALVWVVSSLDLAVAWQIVRLSQVVRQERRVTFCIVIIRCPETFLSPCVNIIIIIIINCIKGAKIKITRCIFTRTQKQNIFWYNWFSFASTFVHARTPMILDKNLFSFPTRRVWTFPMYRTIINAFRDFALCTVRTEYIYIMQNNFKLWGADRSVPS